MSEDECVDEAVDEAEYIDEYEEAPPPELAPGEKPSIDWVPDAADGAQAEGQLQLVVPAIPAAGIARTVIRARGNRASAASQLARRASKLLSSSAVQAVLPPQARVALTAATRLGAIASKLNVRKVGVKAAKAAAKKLRKWLPW